MNRASIGLAQQPIARRATAGEAGPGEPDPALPPERSDARGTCIPAAAQLGTGAWTRGALGPVLGGG